MKKIFAFLFLTLLVNSLFAQNKKDFLTTKNGLKYKIISSKPKTDKGSLGDFISFHFEMTNSKGAVLRSSFKNNKPVKNVKIVPPKNSADVGEIFTYASQGDSILILLSADTLAKYIKRYPPKIDSGSVITYRMKILDILNKEEVEKEKAEKIKNLKAEEFAKIEAYAQANNLELERTASGLHYAITKKGTGQKASPGQKIKVTYIGRLLNGKLFDTCIEEVAKANDKYNPSRSYGSFSFFLGKGQVIKGWDEGFALLSIGDKATFIIPSYLGYGERSRGEDIPSNSILVFEVEFLGIE